MSRINYEDFEDEEYQGGKVKTHSKGSLTKKKSKGHQGRYEKSEREAWAEMETFDAPKKKIFNKPHFQRNNNEDDKGDFTPSFKPKENNREFTQKPIFKKEIKPSQAPVNASTQFTPTPTQAQPARTSTHVFGPNTREIKGVQIDMDGVANIEKIENVQNGQTTFGIKFTFKGSKGFSRTVWFNINIRARDAAYNTEYEFWTNLNRR